MDFPIFRLFGLYVEINAQKRIDCEENIELATGYLLSSVIDNDKKMNIEVLYIKINVYGIEVKELCFIG